MNKNHIQKKKRNTLRRIRHTLMILLPLLVLILTGLLILNQRLNRDTQSDTANALATPDDLTIPPPTAIGSEHSENDNMPDIDSTSESDQTQTAGEPDTEPTIKPAEKSEPVTLLFAGDVLLSDYVLDNYKNAGINGVLSPQLLQELQSADIAIINNEFPFSTRGSQAPDKQFTFRVDPKYVHVLTDIGVDIASLANNHVLDYGADALLDTFDTLEGAGIDYIGAGTDLSRAKALITKKVNGKTFGFLAASRVIPVVSWDVQNASPGVFTTYDPTRLVAAIQAARSSCDYLTVFVHWGIERNEYPESYQAAMAQQYIDAGADLVIGAHPHVLQGITYYKEKPIFYSLGNFIFNRDIPKTAIVKVTISDDKAPVIQLIAASASGARTVACDGKSKNAIYDYLEHISDNITIDEDGILSQK